MALSVLAHSERQRHLSDYAYFADTEGLVASPKTATRVTRDFLEQLDQFALALIAHDAVAGDRCVALLWVKTSQSIVQDRDILSLLWSG